MKKYNLKRCCAKRFLDASYSVMPFGYVCLFDPFQTYGQKHLKKRYGTPKDIYGHSLSSAIEKFVIFRDELWFLSCLFVANPANKRHFYLYHLSMSVRQNQLSTGWISKLLRRSMEWQKMLKWPHYKHLWECHISNTFVYRLVLICEDDSSEKRG